MFTILHDILNKQEKKYKKLAKINWDEVESLGKEIRLRLQLRQIPLDDAINILIPNKSQNKKVASI